jgi:HAD superfamily hydrolase (TIGR01459 family)
MSNSSRPAAISGLSEIAGDYRFILSDVWGVLHNGVRGYEAAAGALARFRAQGGRVVLITNAPRRASQIVEMLARFKIDPASYDEIVTSGEVARLILKKQPAARIYHLGPDRDRPIYDGLPNMFVDEAEADLISCTGLFDDTKETPDDYRDQLARLAKRKVPMLCVNPDRVVERGGDLVWCAGALADVYEAYGGSTAIVGKPYAPIYDMALDRFATLAGAPVSKGEVLAIGDSAPTDVRGAHDQGFDVLFVTGGIHIAEFGDHGGTNEGAVGDFLAAAGLGARNFIDYLKW